MTAGIARARCALIAAAGTGGHVIPGVEVGKELRERGWECVFIGTARGFENRLVPQAGFELLHVPVGALNRVSFRRRLATLLSVPRALAVALRIVSQRRPAAALSLGGYAAGPLALASVLAEVPLVLMEPNAFPGLANRLAAPAACRVLLGHPAAATFFRAGSCQLTGMPVRREFFRIAPRDPGSPFTVLVLGGSQGAARLNRAAIDAVRIWSASRQRPPRLIHQTGEREHAAVAQAYSEAAVDAVTAPFFDDMPARFEQADLVICRAGASVVAELCAARKPAVLVPFPFAADDHQHANAAAAAAAGGALLVRDADWVGERMVREVSRLSADPGLLAGMASALAPLAPAGAVRDAATAVEQAALRQGRTG